jgi:hypothetical protein
MDQIARTRTESRLTNSSLAVSIAFANEDWFMKGKERSKDFQPVFPTPMNGGGTGKALNLSRYEE